MAKKFIAQAIRRPGALRAKAKRLGMRGSGPIPETIMGKLEHSSNPTTLKQANLAKTLKAMH